ncbi:MAG TPA: PHP domain-containing protein [Candidatus Humimicrobiaceae bacterium]|nr:PHP domain-containing protein [Candidatus Humimicrobiaceae bacterium]
MINLRLANILSDIAEVNKSRTDDRNISLHLTIAARSIRDNPERVDKTFAEGKLKDLVGIQGLPYDLIKEHLETGSIGLYEEIKQKYSQDLIRLMRISGFGKKMLFKTYDALNIKTLEDLKEKLNEGAAISGVLAGITSGKDTTIKTYVERLKLSLDYIESIKGMSPRWEVENYVDEIKNSLNRIKDIEKVMVVGSLRRKKSAVKDIDLLILPYFNSLTYDFAKSEKLLDEINSLDFIKRLMKKDIRQENISGRFETVFGIGMELIISSSKNWVIDMLYTTGSKKHIEKLEAVAKDRGFFKDGRIDINAINEYRSDEIVNYPDTSSCTEIDAVRFEEIIYGKLGLQYVPPELREDQGEIELADKHILPELLTMEDIKGDLHVHSIWSDGLISLSNMIEKIKKFRYEYIAISDHTTSNYYGRGLDAERLQRKTNYIERLKSRFKDFRILLGSEIDIRRVDKFDYPDDIIKKMDIAFGSIHSSFLNAREENTARAISAVKNKYIDFVAHPTGVVFGNRAPYFIDIDRLIEEAARNNKALEINSYFLRMDLNEQNVRKAGKMGVKLVINTDAHRPNNMDMIRLGVDIARRAGLQKKDVLNTLPLEELKAWKSQRSQA